ncbi:hypothetical protein CGJ21_11045 [Vibrio parahaemolyticus]|uniref:site-specific integrase n=1 Tax=Vibrio parahaemolyticus TaxID=670 RepID=UPI00111E41DC|nr:site-specific integrase [Vibrio parahaemolyticus]TOF39290.1 hypothetical protein CGJ23_10590 [Vibrio parahaemolyticus]TOF48427.1 hypothetical protein CGJ21_11045 [Vibrio parahaemolyticus]
MKRTGDTIMFIIKDRNSTYYARYYFPKHLLEAGFPPELRFSLSTKERSVAIDRLMLVISAIRQSVSSYKASECSQEFLNNLKEQLNKLRKAKFSVSLISSNPIRKTSRTCSTTARSKRKTKENLLALFIESKRAEKLLPRSIQQLESRITALLKSAKQEPLNLIPKHVMSFRDELLNQSKSTKSVIEYLSASRQFYKWLKLRGDMPINPLEGITVKRKNIMASDERSRWSREQLTKLFKHPSFTNPTVQHRKGQTYQQQLEEFWIPLLLLHTGARSSEICQLDVSDIKQVDGVWCIDINDSGEGKRLKSPASKRIIPIHPKLLEIGFLNYVEQRINSKVIKLFNIKITGQNLDWSKEFARRFNKTLDALGLKKNQRPTLHCLRHTFIDELQILQVPESVVSDLVGHTKPNITYGRYGKRGLPQQLAKTIRMLDFNECLNKLAQLL